jgi:hypothetical protein
MEVRRQPHAPAASHPGKEHRYQLDRRLGGHQSCTGRGGIPSPCRGSNPDRPARMLAAIETELSKLFWTNFVAN